MKPELALKILHIARRHEPTTRELLDPALDVAIAAVKKAVRDQKRARLAGHKGGSTTVKRYGKKRMRGWARRGGRPPKLCTCGHMVRDHVNRARCRKCSCTRFTLRATR